MNINKLRKNIESLKFNKFKKKVIKAIEIKLFQLLNYTVFIKSQKKKKNKVKIKKGESYLISRIDEIKYMYVKYI